MPGHHCFRFDQYESIGPTRIPSPQHHPEEPVRTSESRSRLLTLEHRELLSESSGFQCEFVTRQEEGTNVCDDCKNERTHRSDVSRTASRPTGANPHSTSSFSSSRSGFDDPQVVEPMGGDSGELSSQKVNYPTQPEP